MECIKEEFKKEGEKVFLIRTFEEKIELQEALINQEEERINKLLADAQSDKAKITAHRSQYYQLKA